MSWTLSIFGLPVILGHPGKTEDLNKGLAWNDDAGKVRANLDPPLNFNQMESSVDLLGNKYNALLSWLPPVSNGFSILKYKLTWGKNQSPFLTSSSTLDPQTSFTSEYKISLPPDRLTFKITDLDLNFNYWVKLQVIYGKGNEKLRSNKTKIIVTSELKQPSDDDDDDDDPNLLSHDYQLMYRSRFHPSTTKIHIDGDDDDDDDNDDVYYEDYETDNDYDEWNMDDEGSRIEVKDDDEEDDGGGDDGDDDDGGDDNDFDVGSIEGDEKSTDPKVHPFDSPTKSSLFTNDGDISSSQSTAAYLIMHNSTHLMPMTAHPVPIPVMNIHFDEPYFHNGLVRCHVTWQLSNERREEIDRWPEKYLITWFPVNCSSSLSSSSSSSSSPDQSSREEEIDDDISSIMSATTQKSPFTMYDLWYGCKYHVTIRSVSKYGILGSKISSVMKVPGCHDVAVTGSVKPPCHNRVTSNNSLESEYLGPPTRLRHSYVISGTNITAKLFWDPPVPGYDYHGYMITWFVGGPMGSKDDSMEYVNSTTTEKNKEMVYIKDLLESRSYEIKVQTVSRTGLGDPALVHLHTPGVQNKYATVIPESNRNQGSQGEFDQSDDLDFKFERTNRHQKNRINGSPVAIDFMRWPSLKSLSVMSSSTSSSAPTSFLAITIYVSIFRMKVYKY